MLSAVVAYLLCTPLATPSELLDYVMKPDASYSWREASREPRRVDFDLTSQTWQGVQWKHTVTLSEPKHRDHDGIAVLVVTGGDPNDEDLRIATAVADRSGMPCATLFHIPNQPIWNLREDGLIAHTLVKYLETGEPDWPLLFPMTKSVIRAMDALAEATAKTSNPIKRFVVTGASKRGWTTWLAAATGDARIAGIAPMVYDNLNIPAQMNRQIAHWGRYSEMIGDYTDRGLQQILETPRGGRMAKMIDPYAYRARISAPTLLVIGANDRYWTLDSMSVYWNELRQPHWAVVVPNAGHDLGDGRLALEGLCAFARACAGEFRMPALECSVRPSAKKVAFEVRTGGTVPVELTVWRAQSDSMDFRESKWERAVWIGGESIAQNKGRTKAAVDRGAAHLAFFVEARYGIGDRVCSLSTPIRIVPKRETGDRG